MNGGTRPRNTGSAPVYRYAPRSHAYGCPCGRCTQVRAQRHSGSGAWIWGFFAICGVVSWIVTGIAHHLVTAGIITGMIAGAVLLFAAVWQVNQRFGQVRPPGGRLRVEATPQPAAPCLHRNAVPVNSTVTGELLAYWCVKCETRLDPDFRDSRPVTPPIALIPSGFRAWNWRCSCGISRSGTAAGEPGVEAAVRGCVAAHRRPSHRWQYEWRNFG